MAASPIAVDAATMPPEDKWDVPHEQMVTSPNNSNNGAPHAGDEHHSSHQQPAEDNDSYMRGESAPGEGGDTNGRSEGSHRGEKQIKVLVWSFFSLSLALSAFSLSPPRFPASTSH